MYDLAQLNAVLTGSIFAGNLHFAPETGSTNDDALRAAREGAAHGTVFFADLQTAGRGRGGHQWQSPVGDGLYVSVLLRPRLAAAELALLPLAAGIAAREAIRAASGLNTDLRWPNDLLIGPRKAGGILMEARTEAGRAAYAVVGIGINVHQRAFDPSLATPATSLDVEAGRRVSRQDLLVRLLESLEREARALQADGDAGMLLARVEAASSWLRGRRVQVHGPQACTGITAGLDAHGFLKVATDSGEVTVQTGGIRTADEIRQE